MTTPPSALVPIFRNEAQARVLAWLLLDPNREQSVYSLQKVAEAAYPNVRREVNRLVESGLLDERRVGQTRLVRANTESPYFQPLVAILARSYGPATVIPEVLQQVPGVERMAFIGSWAERYAGIPGPPPRDIDVVAIGNPDRRALRRANAELEERLEQPVQIVPVSAEEWDQETSGFVETAKYNVYAVINFRSAA